MLKYLNILLVEDELEIQKSLQESLLYFFNNVYVANDGLSALAELKKNKIHAVFTDYEMPNMNGYELIKEIRQFDKKIPITIFSNHDDKEKLQKCIPLQLNGYLFKPIQYSDLKTFIEKLSQDFIDNRLLEYGISNTHRINLLTYELFENSTVHLLTKLEGMFLSYLVELDGKIASFNNLEEKLYECQTTNITYKNLVYRIKTKYNFPYIKNIKDIGYVLVVDDE